MGCDRRGLLHCTTSHLNSLCATCPQLESDNIAHVSTIAAAATCPILVASVSSRVAANAVSAARLAGAAGRVVFGEVALAPLVQDFGSRFLDAEQSKEAALALTAPQMRPDAAAPDYLLKLVTRFAFPFLSSYSLLILPENYLYSYFLYDSDFAEARPLCSFHVSNLTVISAPHSVLVTDLSCSTALCSSDNWSVASEHSPFAAELKEAALKKDFTQVPPGVPGVEHRFPLLWQLAVVRYCFPCSYCSSFSDALCDLRVACVSAFVVRMAYISCRSEGAKFPFDFYLVNM